jgi:hypothetical protein
MRLTLRYAVIASQIAHSDDILQGGRFVDPVGASTICVWRLIPPRDRRGALICNPLTMIGIWLVTWLMGMLWNPVLVLTQPMGAPIRPLVSSFVNPFHHCGDCVQCRPTCSAGACAASNVAYHTLAPCNSYPIAFINATRLTTRYIQVCFDRWHRMWRHHGRVRINTALWNFSLPIHCPQVTVPCNRNQPQAEYSQHLLPTLVKVNKQTRKSLELTISHGQGLVLWICGRAQRLLVWLTYEDAWLILWVMACDIVVHVLSLDIFFFSQPHFVRGYHMY